jgi:flavin reductase (DIM6/NTAB) family NADH-FMN oxidoreductase RutF
MDAEARLGEAAMNIEPAHEISPAHFRRVMGRFATGVTVITARAGGEVRGMTANAFMSGSLDPPLCIVSVTKRAHMHGHLEAAGGFAVNILTVGQESYASHFAGRPVQGMKPAFADVAGIPTLADAAARIVAEIASTADCGDHTIFIGHIRWMAADDRPPLLFHAGRYAYLVPVHGEEAPHPEFW